MNSFSAFLATAQKIKKARVNTRKKDIIEHKPLKNDWKIYKQAINGLINDITLYTENFTLHLAYAEYKAKFNENKFYDEFNDIVDELDYFLYQT